MRAWLILLGLGVSACGLAPSEDEDVVKECVLPEDQSSTLTGRWRAAPIPIALRSGKFDSGEKAEIVDAVGTWNRLSNAVFGFSVFDIGDAANPREVNGNKPSALCAQGITNGSAYHGQVVIYKQGTWPYSNHEAIALTSVCPIPGSPYSSFYMAMMELNYQDFFVQGKKIPDLKSILIHELGHLLGLGHSCEGTASTGVPGCNSSSLPNAYFLAVMFPVFRFDSGGIGEQKHSLNSNDQGRFNCLYEGI